MAENTSNRKVLVIHGPNLNMLGTREPDVYGHQTLEEINTALNAQADRLGLQIETFQSNHEGDIVDKIQQAHDSFHGIIINPAAYTHTSIAIRDALSLLTIPVVEIHISNIYKRETFRRTSLISAVVTAQISGFGSHGYMLALEGLAQVLSAMRSDFFAEG
ncbi:MAG: type II 3-dehydroquinate dehydratase [Desulfobacterales bacterium]|jgi:3-dehydroquinate dehydratase-2